MNRAPCTVIRRYLGAGKTTLVNHLLVDLVSAAERSSLRAWLAELAPGTPVIETVRSRVALDVLLGARAGRAPGATGADAPQQSDHGYTYETWTLERAVPVSRGALEGFAAGLGEGILRAKGVVGLEDYSACRHVYQQVGRRWSVEPGTAWDSDQPRTRLVVIGRAGATTAAALEALLGPAGCAMAPIVSTTARTGPERSIR